MRGELVAALLDIIVFGTAYVRPDEYEVALFRSNGDGTYSELEDSNYARGSIPLDGDHWDAPHTHERTNKLSLRIPATGGFATAGLRIDVVAFYAAGETFSDFANVIPGGFTVEGNGYLLFQPGTLVLGLALPSPLPRRIPAPELPIFV